MSPPPLSPPSRTQAPAHHGPTPVRDGHKPVAGFAALLEIQTARTAPAEGQPKPPAPFEGPRTDDSAEAKDKVGEPAGDPTDVPPGSTAPLPATPPAPPPPPPPPPGEAAPANPAVSLDPAVTPDPAVPMPAPADPSVLAPAVQGSPLPAPVPADPSGSPAGQPTTGAPADPAATVDLPLALSLTTPPTPVPTAVAVADSAEAAVPGATAPTSPATAALAGVAEPASAPVPDGDGLPASVTAEANLTASTGPSSRETQVAGGPQADPAVRDAGTAPASPSASPSQDPARDDSPAGQAAGAPAPSAPSSPASTQAPAPAFVPERATPGAAPQQTVPLHRAAETVGQLLQIAYNRGITHARVALNPIELGGIAIRLQTSAAGVTAQVVADSPEATRMLTQAAADLRRSLENSGVTLLALDVSTQDDRRSESASAGFAHHAEARERDGWSDRGGRPSAVSLADDPFDDPSTATTIELPDGVLVDVLA